LTSTALPASADQPSRRLWVVWLLFFFNFLAVGSYYTYLNVYYRQAGLTGTQIGLLTMTGSIIGVISSVVWGYVSDLTGKPKILMAISALGALVVAQFVPLASTFWEFYGLACLAGMLTSSIGTLMDGVTLAMLGARGEEYGRYRLGGSIGYILASFSSGFIYDRTGLELIFRVYGIFMGLYAGAALLLPGMPAKTGEKGNAEIGWMIRQSTWLVFAACVFLVWIANMASIMYLGVFLSSMGASKGLIGIAYTSGAVLELPFMAYSGWFIRRFGLARLMLAGMSLMVLRYALLGWMPEPGWAVAINAINGPAYAFFGISSVAYARKLAPPSLAITSQGLLNSTISLAGVVSALLTGILFDRIGPNNTFVVMAGSCLAALVLFAAGAYHEHSKNSGHEVEL
jgi:MFS transporter, PPP family, 3-phenylpropionic acid transporter